MHLVNVFYKNGKIYQKYVSKLPITENRIEKLLLNRFYCRFCSGRWSKNFLFFLGHISISQPILNIMSWNSAYIPNLILWSQIWTHMFIIKSLWRHNNVIVEKSVNNKLHQLKSMYISIQCHKLFSSLVDISTIAYLFIISVKKAKLLKNSWKIWLYLSKKLAVCWWRHQNKRNVC